MYDDVWMNGDVVARLGGDANFARRLDRNFGAFFGLAYGDALGGPVEFTSYARAARYVRRLVTSALPTTRTAWGTPVALVTDDTQMSLAVADALVDAHADVASLTPDGLRETLIDRFIEWVKSPDNNRAPGAACVAACRDLAATTPCDDRVRRWLDSTQITARGCGASMRVAPVAMIDVPHDVMSGVAQMQAAITHGHPAALAASELTAALTRAFVTGQVTPSTVLPYLRDYVSDHRRSYPHEWLGTELARRWWARSTDPHDALAPDVTTAYAVYGWNEMDHVLRAVETAVTQREHVRDLCAWVGDGWTADEAFGCGLLAFLIEPDDPVMAIRRGAATSGDSDSIASIAGTFAGAFHGFAAWPHSWTDEIEYGADISDLAGILTTLDW